MKVLKKILALSLAVVFVFGFLLSITEVPSASAANECNEYDDSLHCWRSGASQLCSRAGGVEMCGQGEF